MLRAIQARDQFDQFMMWGLQQSDTIYAIVLSANTSQQIAVPTGANLVLFGVSGGNDVYMLFSNTSISVPGSNITNGTAPELVEGGAPMLRSCAGKTYVSLVSANACVVTMAFYS
jgi:hypothetical protein